jgi:hypothetical protein
MLLRVAEPSNRNANLLTSTEDFLVFLVNNYDFPCRRHTSRNCDRSLTVSTPARAWTRNNRNNSGQPAGNKISSVPLGIGFF